MEGCGLETLARNNISFYTLFYISALGILVLFLIFSSRRNPHHWQTEV